jgi:hypothetical protein
MPTITISTRTGSSYSGGMRSAELYQTNPDTSYLDKGLPEASEYVLGDARVTLLSLVTLPAELVGASVTSATLSVQVNSLSGAANALDVRRVKTSADVTQATWNSAKAGASWVAAGGFGSSDSDLLANTGPAVANQGLTFSSAALTAAVQSWAAGSFAALNLLLTPTAMTSGSNAGTYTILTGATDTSLAPVLTVTYNAGAARKGLVQDSGAFSELPAGDTFAGPVNSNHAAYAGLTNDNHTQYFNQARGDARYTPPAHTQGVDTLTQSGASATAFMAVWSGTQWVAQAPAGLTTLTTSMTATQQSVSTTLANVLALALPMLANGVYQVEAGLSFQTAAATTGINVGVTGPTGSRVMVEITVPLTSTAAATQLRTTFPNAAVATNTASVLGTGVTAASSTHTARVSGIIRNGTTAGFCQIQFASEVAASAVTLQVGSTLSLTKIA